MYKFIKSNKDYSISLLLGAIILTNLQWLNRALFADPDGFYHAKVSQLLASGRLTDNFTWLPYTTWGSGFADQHYLYHLLLIPFNTIDKLQASVVIFALLAFALFLLTLYKAKTPHLWFWSLLFLAGSVDFTFRINLVKANTLSLALMFASILLLLWWRHHQNQPAHPNDPTHPHKTPIALLALTSFIFVWTYGGFVFLPIIVVAYAATILILEKKLDFWPVIAVATGLLLGIILHPHHQHLLQSLNNQLFQTGLRAGSAVPAGNEWLPYNLDWFIKTDFLVLLAWLISFLVAANELRIKKITWLTFWLQGLALGFLILALLHRRFIEYYVPFAVLAAATTFTPSLKTISLENIKQALKDHWQIKFAAAAFAIVSIYSFQYNLRQVNSILADGDRGNRYQQAAQTISSASQPGDIILTTQWDQFPQLWYWDDKNYYLVGMDPTFFYLQDQQKYWAWRTIGDDNPDDWHSPEQVYDIIHNQLNSKFVFVETNRNPDIAKFLNNYPELFQLIYHKGTIQVFAVK